MYRKFEFDSVFSEGSSNLDVFEESVQGKIEKFLEGYNSSVFVYGQTGTGKTYTMGILEKMNSQSTGLIPSTLKYVFNKKDTERSLQDASICISMVQIYKDELMDLLNPTRTKISIREDPESKTFFIPRLVIVPLNNVHEAFELVNAGLMSRAMAAQKLNSTSSRSHFILTLYLRQQTAKGEILSKMMFVDLAGNERVSKSTSIGPRLEEARHINSSLSCLASAINSLRTSTDTYHFRKSKLTKILQSSLVGESYICMIGMLRKSPSFTSESLATIDFILKCQLIKRDEPIQMMYEEIFESVNVGGENVNQDQNYGPLREIEIASELTERRREDNQSVASEQEDAILEAAITFPDFKEFTIFLGKCLISISRLLLRVNSNLKENFNNIENLFKLKRGGDFDSYISMGKEEYIPEEMLADLNISTSFEESFSVFQSAFKVLVGQTKSFNSFNSMFNVVYLEIEKGCGNCTGTRQSTGAESLIDFMLVFGDLLTKILMQLVITKFESLRSDLSLNRNSARVLSHYVTFIKQEMLERLENMATDICDVPEIRTVFEGVRFNMNQLYSNLTGLKYGDYIEMYTLGKSVNQQMQTEDLSIATNNKSHSNDGSMIDEMRLGMNKIVARRSHQQQSSSTSTQTNNDDLLSSATQTDDQRVVPEEKLAGLIEMNSNLSQKLEAVLLLKEKDRHTIENLQKDLLTKEIRIEQLEEISMNSKSQSEHSKSENIELRSQLKIFEHQQLEIEAQVEKYRTLCSEMKAELESTKLEKVQLETQLEESKMVVSSHFKRIEELTNEIKEKPIYDSISVQVIDEELEQAMDEYQQELVAQKTEIGRLQEEIIHKDKKLLIASSSSTEKEKEYESMINELTVKLQKHVVAKQENDIRLQEYVQLNDQLQGCVDELNLQLEKVRNSRELLHDELTQNKADFLNQIEQINNINSALQTNFERANAELKGLVAEKENLERKLNDTLSQLETYKSEVDAREKESKDKIGEYQSTKFSLEHREREVSILKDEVTELSDELNSTKLQLSKTKESMIKIAKEFENLSQALKKEVERSQDKDQKLKESENISAQLKQTLKEKNQQIIDLNQNIKSKDESISKLNNQLAQLEGSRSKVESDISQRQNELSEKLEEYKQELSEARNEKLHLQERVADLQRQHKKDIKSLNDQLFNSEERLQLKDSEILNLEENLSDKIQSIRILQEKEANLTEEVKSVELKLKDTVENYEKRLKQLEEVNSEKGGSLNSLKETMSKQIAENHQIIQQLQNNISSSKSEISVLERKVSSQEAEINEQREERNKLASTISKLNIRIGLLETELAQKDEKMDSVALKLRGKSEKVSELTIELTSKISQIDSLKMELSNLQTAKLSLEENLKLTSLELQRVQDKIDDRDNQIQTSRTLNEQAEHDNKEKSMTVEQLKKQLLKLNEDYNRLLPLNNLLAMEEKRNEELCLRISEEEAKCKELSSKIAEELRLRTIAENECKACQEKLANLAIVVSNLKNSSDHKGKEEIAKLEERITTILKEKENDYDNYSLNVDKLQAQLDVYIQKLKQVTQEKDGNYNELNNQNTILSVELSSAQAKIKELNETNKALSMRLMELDNSRQRRNYSIGVTSTVEQELASQYISEVENGNNQPPLPERPSIKEVNYDLSKSNSKFETNIKREQRESNTNGSTYKLVSNSNLKNRIVLSGHKDSTSSQRHVIHRQSHSIPSHPVSQLRDSGQNLNGPNPQAASIIKRSPLRHYNAEKPVPYTQSSSNLPLAPGGPLSHALKGQLPGLNSQPILRKVNVPTVVSGDVEGTRIPIPHPSQIYVKSDPPTVRPLFGPNKENIGQGTKIAQIRIEGRNGGNHHN